MNSKWCVVCKIKFYPCPQVPRQTHCSLPKCQRERRRKTQQNKRRSDPDYKDNQSRSQKDWIKRNPNYWREYRRAHPEYIERNRAQQRKRNSNQKLTLVAKMNESSPHSPVFSGVYRLRPADVTDIAKMDEWIVEIKPISGTYALTTKRCKERT